MRWGWLISSTTLAPRGRGVLPMSIELLEEVVSPECDRVVRCE